MQKHVTGQDSFELVVSVHNSEDVDKDYDTDNEIGPFYDQVVDEGELVEAE